MSLDNIKNKIQHRQPKPEGNYNRFSVLVPIVEVDGELELLFEIRSEKLKKQPSEICFPGGRIEKNELPLSCAIRETCEELLITPDKIEVFSPLDYLVTPFNMILYPFLGSIHDINLGDFHFNKDEVSDVFTVPMSYFIDHEPLQHHIHMQTFVPKDFPFHMIQNGENYNWKTGNYPVLFYKYKDYIIWGMTARIIKNLVDILKE